MVAGGEEQEGAPLLNRESGNEWPAPIRAIIAAATFLYIVLGKKDSLIGLTCLVMGSVVTIFVTIFLGWFAGCFTMVLCFASCFCLGAGNAARGKYEIAAPILLASLLLVASGILGSHFFAMYHKTASGILIGSPDHPIPVESLANGSTASVHRAHVYLSDGEVHTTWTGEKKWCKDKLPVVGTCINRYFCVAPIVPENFNTSDIVPAWAGVMWTTSCYGMHFLNAPAREAWEHDYRRGIGMVRDRHWDDAVAMTLKKYGLRTTEQAPLLQWVEDPDSEQDWSLSMGILVEVVCLSVFLAVIAIYNSCSGNAKSAYPEARKIMYGPEDPVYQRYRLRTRTRTSTATAV